MNARLVTLLLFLPALAGCLSGEEAVSPAASEEPPDAPTSDPTPASPPDEPTLQPFHGSALVEDVQPTRTLNLSWYSDDALLGYANETDVQDGRLVIPFLEPATAYRAELTTLDGVQAWNFTTTPSPYPPYPEGESLIQPGAPSATCTIGWILRDATNDTLYAVSAGHCGDTGDPFYVTRVRQAYHADPVTELEERIPIGTIAVSVQNDGPEDFQDWLVVRINSTMRQNVTPEVRHWTGPVGTMKTDAGWEDDAVCIHGQGARTGYTDETRSRCFRYSHLSGGGIWYGIGTADNGESGGPVIHWPTGQAVGIVTEVLGRSLTYGNYLCTILNHAYEDHGLHLRLLTADYEPAFPSFHGTGDGVIDPSPTYITYNKRDPERCRY